MRAVPPTCADATRAGLSDLSPELVETFEIRLERWWPDIADGLAQVYSPREVDALGPALADLAATTFRDRDPALRRLDARRQLEPDWLASPRMAGYAAYADRFAGDLPALGSRLDYLQDLGVTYLHLMPLLASRPGDDDGGYAIVDYGRIRPDLGTWDDLVALTRRLRERGMSLCLDLVLNHVAAEHPWAAAARAGQARYRDYFHVFDDREGPDAYEATLPEVFPDFAPGSFTWDDELDGWVWTTFNAFQWDVNWANPEVLLEYARIVCHLANAGVDILRLDAIAFMWKRLGTRCQGEPEVHALTQVLRALARIACPAVAFKAEAIVAPAELPAYLGQGRFHGKVSDLAYHNSLMVQIWSMLATKDARLFASAMAALPPMPPNATWITYLRCHDDIGWAVGDDDAAAVGLSGPLHRAFLSDWFCGAFPGSPARGLVFQENPATGDRRISGTAASLVGLETALERGDEEGVDLALAALRCAHAIIAGWGGVPVVWSGDELATCNDPAWADEPGHAADNRWVHRPRLDAAALEGQHDPASVAGRAFADLRHVLATRASLPHLHASTPTQVGPVDDPGVLVTLRRHPLGGFVGLYNITPSWRSWPGHRLDEHQVRDAVEALGSRGVGVGGDGDYWLPPYGVAWLVAPPR